MGKILLSIFLLLIVMMFSFKTFAVTCGDFQEGCEEYDGGLSEVIGLTAVTWCAEGTCFLGYDEDTFTDPQLSDILDGGYVNTAGLSPLAMEAIKDLNTIVEGKFDTPSGTTSQYVTGDGTLENFPSIPAAQVNSDWDASSGVAQVLNKPTLGTSSAFDVASSGNASSGQVVKGNDTRLSDARTPTAHVHAASDVTSGSFADARVAQSNVTQYQSALSLIASQISDFATTVRSVALTGLSTSSSAVITASDTILSAFGKLQAQITEIGNKVLVIGSPNSRSMSLATAYQCTDNTKPCTFTITTQCPLNTGLTGSATCAGEIRIGSANTVASGGSGTVMAPLSRSVSGLTTLLVFQNNDNDTTSIQIPTGWYIAVRQTTGTGLTVQAAFDQSISIQ